MLKDINFNTVTDLGMAIVEENDNGQPIWSAYIINFGETAKEKMLITSEGYKVEKDKHLQTSTLRWFMGDVAPNSFAKIEEIPSELHHLNNEFMVSFYIGTQIYDRKFIFVEGSISKENLTTVPIINKKGILIK
ncbi:MAG: hypothetical protein H6553_11385 [Chitinophagales bacterium]|nr:hypothetical protein [Chitinophagales bacterium]